MHRTLLVLSLLLIAGCVEPNVSEEDEREQENPCNEAYYAGCDDNPDAHYMLEIYGLRQFTNSSVRVMDPQVHDGLAVWREGPLGGTSTFWALAPESGQFYAYRSPDRFTGRGIFVDAGSVLVNEAPEGPGDIFERNVPTLWQPVANETVQLQRPPSTRLVAAGLDNKWALMIIPGPDHRTHHNGIGTLDTGTGEFQEFVAVRPNDDSYFGGPFIWQAIGGGYAFLSMLYDHGHYADNAIIAINLTTGERREILNVTNHAIQDMDASSDYLVLTANIEGKHGVWAWSIHDEEWFFVQEGRDWGAIAPRVGGDWIVYMEPGDAKDFLVGFHLPSRTYYELGGENGWSLIKWDTDGRFVVVHIDAWRRPLFQQAGEHLYWKKLPDLST